MSRSGGCQCGAVRFRVEDIGRASICHCRMCQKATGGFFGPYVDAVGLTWTKVEPKRFRSSEAAERGFCEACGTPLTFEAKGETGLSIGAFDDPATIAPVTQLIWDAKLPYVDHLGDLPEWKSSKQLSAGEAFEGVASYQHPDHD